MPIVLSCFINSLQKKSGREIHNLEAKAEGGFIKPYLALADRAVMGTPASENDPADRRSTDQAWLAGTHVHLVLKLEEAGDPIRVDIIGDR